MLSDTLFECKRYFIDGAESELRAQHNTGRRVSFLDGQMIGNVRQDYKGVSARVRRGGLYGFSSKGEYTLDSVKSVLNEASNNALFLEKHVKSTKGRLSPCRQA